MCVPFLCMGYFSQVVRNVQSNGVSLASAAAFVADPGWSRTSPELSTNTLRTVSCFQEKQPLSETMLQEFSGIFHGAP